MELEVGLKIYLNKYDKIHNKWYEIKGITKYYVYFSMPPWFDINRDTVVVGIKKQLAIDCVELFR